MARRIRSPQETYQHLKLTLKNVKESSGGTSFTALCPVHDDQNNSLSVSIGDSGRLLVHCFVGCSTTDILYACDVLWAECFPRGYEPPDAKKEPAIVAVYSYHDEQGQELFQAVKYDNGRWKYRRREGDKWVYSIEKCRRVLYRLPDLMAASIDTPIMLVEGEKDAETLRALGYVATTNPCGASHWRPEFTETLRGRRVLIFYDNDDPGYKRAERLKEELEGKAAFVAVVDLPDVPLKGDVTDWLAMGHTADELQELIDAALNPPKVRGSATGAEADGDQGTRFEQQLVDALGLEVLGHTDAGKVQIFSRYHRRVHEVDLSRLRYAEILQLCGPVAKDRVDSGKSSDPGVATVSQVRNALALLSGFRRIRPEKELGPGCWLGCNDRGLEDGSVLLVNACGASVWKDGQLTTIDVPHYGAQVLDFTSDKPWFDHARLQSLLGDFSHEWASDVIDECEEVLRRWRWGRQDVDPRLVTAMILATWVQTVWQWRPQVAILGASETGKSVLLTFLGDLFGPLAIRTSAPSPAGLRQKIQHSARIPLVDEHDANRQKRELLEMVRASSRGDVTLRGTTGKQQGHSFLLQQIFWIAGITMPRNRAPDRNRFIYLELLPPEKGKTGQLKLPPTEESANLGQKMLAVAVATAIRARDLAAKLKTVQYDDVDPRIIESYAVPTATLAAATDLAEADAVDLLKWLIPVEDGDFDGLSDEADLLAHIFDADVFTPGGKRLAVGQMLARRHLEPDYDELLESRGLKLVEMHVGRGRPRSDAQPDAVFIDPRKAHRYLLKGTDWDGQNVDDVLRRVPGAERCRRTIASKRATGVAIPIQTLAEMGVWLRNGEAEEEGEDGLDTLF